MNLFQKIRLKPGGSLKKVLLLNTEQLILPKQKNA